MYAFYCIPRLVHFLLLASTISPAIAVDYAAIPRVLPAPATALPAKSVSDTLLKEVDSVKERIANLRRKEPELAADVEIFFKAAGFALEIGEFWDPKDIGKVLSLKPESPQTLNGSRSQGRPQGVLLDPKPENHPDPKP